MGILSTTKGEQRYYANVIAGGVSTQDFTPANGAIIHLTQIGGSCQTSTGNNTSNVQVIWDALGTPQIIFACYTTQDQPIDQTFIGDGTKVFRIRLSNSNLFSLVLGAYFQYEQTVNS